jgi:hypothetical protein
MRTKQTTFKNWTYTCYICGDSTTIEKPPLLGTNNLPDWEELTFLGKIIAHVCPKQKCKILARKAYPNNYDIVYKAKEAVILEGDKTCLETLKEHL